MKTFIALVALVIIALIGFGFLQGWVNFSKTEDRATIEIETGEMEQAAERAEREGQRLLNRAGEALERAGQELDEAVEDPDEELEIEVDLDEDEQRADDLRETVDR